MPGNLLARLFRRTLNYSANSFQVVSMNRRVYLAGPDVFLPNAHARGEEMKSVCARYSLEAIYPLDNTPDPALSGRDLAIAIRDMNLRSIEACDALIVNMTPFRGPSMDVGTAYEMGVAEGLGKPVVAWSENRADYRIKMRRYSDLHSIGGVLYASDGMMVEDLGLADNLMVSAMLDVLYGSFEEAVREAAQILTGASLIDEKVDSSKYAVI